MQMSEDVITYISPNSGVVVPKRIFVGGIPYGCTSDDLKQFFSSFGFVVHSNIIRDTEGLSKGYGFISFERKTDAQNVQRMGTLFFKDKKLKIGPAIRRSSEEKPVRKPKGNLENIYVASNDMPLSWNNAMSSSDYLSMLTYGANLQFPLASTHHIASPHHPKLLNFNCPSSCTVSGCLMSYNANECGCVSNAPTQSTILQGDPLLYNTQCQYIACSTPYKL